MRRYMLRRLLLILPTLLGVAVLVFLLMRVVPGDIVEMRFAEGQFFNAELVAKERARLGLDRPLWRQFLDWLWGMVRLDFGLSMWSGNPIAREIALRLQLSLQLAVMATVVAVLLAIPLGTLAALRQDSWVDYMARVFAIAGLATPSFWLGIVMFLILFAVFRWIPPMVFTPLWENPWQNLSQMIWPALAVGYRLLRCGDAYDALSHARCAAGRLHSDGARQGALAAPHCQASCLEERLTPGPDGYWSGVCLFDGRTRGHRASL